jgi:hypothetical protein
MDTRLLSKALSVFRTSKLAALHLWECGYDWSERLQHEGRMAFIGQYCLYIEAKMDCDISPHLDGFSESRTEKEAGILICFQRSIFSARIVIENDPLLSAGSVGGMQDRGLVN